MRGYSMKRARPRCRRRAVEKPAKYDEVTVKRVLELLDINPPAGYGRWNGQLIAEHLADVSLDQVWRILRQQGIEFERRHSWCISTDPEFARKVADIVGLYLNPPQIALIFAIDEKPAIQALEWAQCWVRRRLSARRTDADFSIYRGPSLIYPRRTVQWLSLTPRLGL
jgi:hypothetical protein